jgi:hypothetical protein
VKGIKKKSEEEKSKEETAGTIHHVMHVQHDDLPMLVTHSQEHALSNLSTADLLYGKKQALGAETSH